MRVRFAATLVASLTALGVFAAVAGADLGQKFGKGLRAALAPSPGVPSTATGSAVVRLDPAEGFVCFKLVVDSPPDAPVAAHIHRGAAGQDGPVVVPFVTPKPTAAGTYESKGCVSADPALIREIQANPAGFYVNVHTAKFPASLMRGQLVRLVEKAAKKPTCVAKKTKKKSRR
jgi:hypothetical protein